MAANIYRDKVINEISEKDVGSHVRAAGWIENIRDHGGVSFIDLRDMYGVLQVVMRDTTLLEGLSSSFGATLALVSSFHLIILKSMQS